MDFLSFTQLQLIEKLALAELKKHQQIKEKGHICTSEWLSGNPCDAVYGCPQCEQEQKKIKKK